ncbi:MAG TPA: Clp protease N-terminal domain-containing protein [Acidimicrobiales bacterium]|nr:Clp protease N-terminal domain-containing protein [Acidimicrobiales bacterium]
MFERFTDGARHVLVEAQDLAVELGSAWLAPAHVLYAAAESGDPTAAGPLAVCGVRSAEIRRLLPRTRTTAREGQADPVIDADALRSIGIDYDQMKAAVDQTFGEGALEAAPDRRHRPHSHKPCFTPATKQSLALAVRAALSQPDRHRIEAGHVLLGVLRVDDSLVETTLQQAGTTTSAVTTAVVEALRHGRQDRTA